MTRSIGCIKFLFPYWYATGQRNAIWGKINDNLEQQAWAIFQKNLVGIYELPENWKRSNLLEIANYVNGLAMQKFRPAANESFLPVIKIRELRQGFFDDSSEQCKRCINPEYIIHDGDIIFSWSGSLLLDIWCGGTGGLNQHLFKVSSNNFEKWFYYFWTRYHLNKFASIAASKATTMGHIKREDLAKSFIIIPTKDIYNKLSIIINPMMESIIKNKIENKELIKTRNLLLTKLMTNEIDLSEVEI